MALEEYKFSDPVFSKLHDLHARYDRNKTKQNGTALALYLNKLIEENREVRLRILGERVIKSMTDDEKQLYYKQKSQKAKEDLILLLIDSKELSQQAYTEHDMQNLSGTITNILAEHRGRGI